MKFLMLLFYYQKIKPVNILESDNSILYSSNNIIVQITKIPFQIKYFNKKNNLILSEKNGYTKKRFNRNFRFQSIDATEKLYGGGARVH